MAQSSSWSVPRMWEGKTVVVLASGESMSQRVADQVHESGFPTIAVNNTFLLAPWADVLYAADYEWWPWCRQHKGAQLAAFQGLKVSVEPVAFPGILGLKNTGLVGFDPDPSCVRTGGNSGYQAIHVAAHAGAKQILLCGFDMHGSNWHGRHCSPLRDHGGGRFAVWLERMGTLVGPLQERGVKVSNTTPDSALKCWPFMPIEEALASTVPA